MKYLEKFKLNKKTAFILGGSGLIGSEIVKAIHEAGAKVIVLEKNFSKSQNFQEKNGKTSSFAQFLRRVPSFAAIGPFGAEILGGGLQGPPPVREVLKIAQLSKG